MIQSNAGHNEPTDSSPVRVMIIEDEPLISMAMKMVLETLGYDVLAVVDNSNDAIETAQSRRLDLVLADARLKGGDDGIGAVKQILDIQPVKVLFITGNPAEVNARGMGYLGIMTKPFMPTMLKKKLQAMMN